MNRCYAVNTMELNKKPYALYATEGEGCCIAYDCETFGDKKTLWEAPGGTMSLVPIPGKENQLLAVQKFFHLFEWEEAELVWTRMDENGKFVTKTLFKLPYLHRFDILSANGTNYLIACTLAAHKKTRDDWTYPGSVYVAKLPEDLNEPIKLETLHDGFYKNHGYQHVKINNVERAMIACDSGVYIMTPPQKSGDSWKTEQIMTQPCGDAAMTDIDNDGEMEIATIEQFHGCYYRIYKKHGGKYEMVFQHPEVSEFYHVVNSGILGGSPVFVGGCRRGKQQLFVVSWNSEKGSFEITTVDEGTGPSNACIFNMADRDLLICANREVAQAAVYILKK